MSYKELEVLGFFEWLSETHKLKDTDMNPEYLDGLALNSIHRTVCNATAFRWFREKYDLDSFIKPSTIETKKVYDYYIWFTNEKDERDLFIGMNNQYSYEEAELACLNKLIEITKQ